MSGRPHLADLKAMRVPPAYKLLVKQCLAADAAFRFAAWSNIRSMWIYADSP